MHRGSRLVPFDPRAASQVASWAASPREVADWCARDVAPVPSEVVEAWSREPDVESWLLVEPAAPATAHAADGWRAVAYGELWLDREEGEVELARLLVDPHRRNRGIGRTLAARLAARAREVHPDLPLVVLRVRPGNAAAIRAYAAAGFQRVPPEVETTWNRDQPTAWSWMRLA